VSLVHVFVLLVFAVIALGPLAAGIYLATRSARGRS